jgi:hypothetical protein
LCFWLIFKFCFGFVWFVDVVNGHWGAKCSSSVLSSPASAV